MNEQQAWSEWLLHHPTIREAFNGGYKAALQNSGAVANEPPTAAAAPLCVKCKKPIVNGYCCGCALDFLPDEA